MNNLSTSSIESLILSVRDKQVMTDRDLAMLYNVETKQLNRQVKRNIERFPDDFMFQLTQDEYDTLRCQFGTAKWAKTRTLPYVFTENGIAMLSGILRSQTAIEANIRIMRAFTTMRKFILSNAQVFQKIETLEYRQQKTDRKIDEIFKRLDSKTVQPTQGIFYDGQIYDAYVFVADLIRTAKERILLIDNYIDDTVLTLLDKRNATVDAIIYTSCITESLQLDINRHNSQYPAIDVRKFKHSHDRFLCIDNKVYHIGASIKDLGKKWFAFSLLEDTSSDELIRKINSI